MTPTPYSLLAAFGTTLGLWMVVRSAPERQASRWLNGALLCLGFSLFGARLGYLLMNLAYYRQVPFEAFSLWAGGLSAAGGLVGGLLGVGLAMRAGRVRLVEALDRWSGLLPPLTASLWIGCYFSGCAYGAQVNWGLPAPDEAGNWARRVPVQFLAALTLIAYFAGLEWFQSYRTQRPALKAIQEALSLPGMKAALSLAGLAINLFVFSDLRADPEPVFYHLRPDTWAAAGLLILAVGSMIIFLIRKA